MLRRDAARGTRRRHAARRLLVELVGLRAPARSPGDGVRWRPTRSRRTASPSWRRSDTASPSRASTRASSRVVLRYFNVFGPRQSPVLAVRRGDPAVHRRGSPPASRSPINGDGEQSRDFTYVANVVDATIRAAEAADVSGNAIFNVAASAPASVNELADTIGSDARPSPSRRCSRRRAPATSVTPGRTSRRRARRSAGSRRSISKTACDAPSRRCLADAPVRIMRMIARLNMGGPALHVSYLTDGLTARGYETTLLAGQLARGEDSMAFVADDSEIRRAQRPAAPPRDLPDLRPDRDPPDRPGDPARPAAHPAYAYREGRSRRPRGGVARRRCAARPSSCTPFTGMCCAAISIRSAPSSSAGRNGHWLGTRTRLIAVSPEVRDDLVEPRRRAGRASSR